MIDRKLAIKRERPNMMITAGYVWSASIARTRAPAIMKRPVIILTARLAFVMLRHLHFPASLMPAALISSVTMRF